MSNYSFSPDIVKFLKRYLPSFFAVRPHKRLEWLTDVADKTMVEFALPKQNDVRNATEYRKKIIQWFYSKNTPNGRMKYANTILHTRNRFRLAQVLSARVLYGKDKNNSSRITAAADALFKTGENQASYVKIWNQVLDEEWNQLSTEQRRPYFVEVKKLKLMLTGPPNNEQIHRKQDTSADDLMKSFDRLCFEQNN